MNKRAFNATNKGFSLLEIGVAVVLLSIIAVPLLRGAVSEHADIQTGETQTTMTEEAKVLTTSTINLVEEILSRSVASVETALTTVDATPGSSTTTTRAAYSANGVTYYYEVDVREMSHLMNTSGGLVNWRGTSVGAGSAVHFVPQGNSMYQLVLSVFADAVTTTPLRVQSFYLPSTSCGPANAFCPTYAGDPVTYYESLSNRYGLSL